MLHHWFTDTFSDPSTWFEARLSFTRTCAVMSMIGFAVGLGAAIMNQLFSQPASQCNNDNNNYS